MGKYQRSEEASLDFEARVKHATDKAVLLEVLDDGMVNSGQEMWVPESQLMRGSIREAGAVGTARVTHWWAAKKGLCE